MLVALTFFVIFKTYFPIFSYRFYFGVRFGISITERNEKDSQYILSTELDIATDKEVTIDLMKECSPKMIRSRNIVPKNDIKTKLSKEMWQMLSSRYTTSDMYWIAKSDSKFV